MVNVILLAVSCILELRYQTAEKPYEEWHQAGQNLFPDNETEWAGSRETISLLRSRRSFFLDIPFYRTH